MEEKQLSVTLLFLIIHTNKYTIKYHTHSLDLAAFYNTTVWCGRLCPSLFLKHSQGFLGSQKSDVDRKRFEVFVCGFFFVGFCGLVLSFFVLFCFVFCLVCVLGLFICGGLCLCIWGEKSFFFFFFSLAVLFALGLAFK